LNSVASRHEATTIANLTLSAYSLDVLNGLERDHDLTFDSSRTGSLKIFRSTKSLETASKLTGLLRDYGLDAQIMTADQAAAREPCLSPVQDQLAGAIYYPGDGSGDAHLFSRAVASMFRQLGGILEFNRTVTSIDGVDGQTVLVRADDRTIVAERVIIATGVASPSLAAQFKLKLRIKPVKGYSVTYTPPARQCRPVLPVIDDALHAAITPLGDRLRVAGTAEFAGSDLRLDPRRVENLSRLIKAIYPEIMDDATLAKGRAWAGLRPVTADGRPYIGRGEHPKLWVNTGHGHLGWTMAAGSARLLADLIEGKPGEIDATPFRLSR
jgi:D-amino-acid dehydrogenase